ncbi:type VII secretion protein EccCa [Mycolicibacterium arseniciresistens]|uniref:Type VII secretion protein EccCa n=1 Tax=Mycolicibacterium arseniciresistens TaxID=3062257 RepID=A0ABT8UMB7_9MYCO|nr:type VII secretion protein EccCa [Mycolicibacterium arseniciresistens]MDO3638934.1 type VII secretion protein EccCa [Mycolicibacterium arseniciresistens]
MEFIRGKRLSVPAVADGDIAVQPPPEVPHVTPANPLARLLPVAMVVAAGGMMVLYFTSGASGPRSPMYLLFPVMMVLSLVGTLAYGLRGARTAELDQGRRNYLRYLQALDRAAAETARAQHRSSHWRHPPPDGLWTLAGGARMWERAPTDDDFGHVRLGLGTQPLSTRLIAPPARPVEEPDPVATSAVDRLIGSRGIVTDVPVAVDLFRGDAIAVTGAGDAVRTLLRAVLCQVAVLHGPEHVRIAAVTDPTTGPCWDWLKWFPHHRHPDTFDGAGPARMTYTTVAAARDAAADLLDGCAGIVIVVDLAVPEIPEPLRSQTGAAVTVLLVAAAGTTPRGTTPWIVDGGVLTLDDGQRVLADGLDAAAAVACARRLAPYLPVAAEADDPLLSRTDWPALVGIDLTHLDTADVWRSRDAAAQLRVPVGVSEHGEPVHIDVKEAAHRGMGPHGLCIGATGSGKSEFLRTLTLGMLVSHPPDRLNVILIDFKGGATFLGFDRAAHVSAVITNLADEAHLVARMKDALSGEVTRRQEALRAAGNFADIAEYHRAKARRPDLPALPSLLIVVDEFSELLSQHPDFAELFVAIGRLGRSLGMHLLLASQRLDEGRLRGLDNHLSYRVCLKTFSAGESRAVLGVPDAHHLPGAPGAAYLRTATGELIRFQTAYVSGTAVEPVRSSATAPIAVPFSAVPVPRPPAEAGPGASSGRSVLDTVLDRLAGHGTPAHRVWLPPLTEPPTLDQLLTHGGLGALTVPIGLVDRPFKQRRDLVTAVLSGAEGNVAVVGGPRSGKSTALRTLALALAATSDPRDVQLYCLDFGGGALAALHALPHVGAVAGRHESDLVRRTVAELESVVRARELGFRELDIDSVSEFRRRRAAGDPAVAADPFGDVFLVVDGWAVVRQDFEGLDAAITALAAQGLSFGVHVVLAASRWADIRPALKDQLGTRIELRLGDPAESEMDRRRARDLVDCPPGRGITRDGADFTIALPRLDGVAGPAGLADALADGAQYLRARHHGRGAAPIRLLPARVELSELTAAAALGGPVVLGVGERRLAAVTLDFDEQSHLIVLGEPGCGKTSTLRTLCAEIVRTRDARCAELVIVDYRRTLLGVVETDHLRAYLMSVGAVNAHLPALLERLRGRLPGDEVTQRQLRDRSWWSGPEIYLVVDDYDLVAGSAGHPLTALVDYLPHAKDIGLHVVVARRSGGAARAMFDPLLSQLRDLGTMGLLMSVQPEDGVLLGSVRPAVRPPGRAVLLARTADEQIVQVGWTEPP